MPRCLRRRTDGDAPSKCPRSVVTFARNPRQAGRCQTIQGTIGGSRRAGEGDERAFAELVERHRDALLRYVARRFRPDHAEDAVQEALLSAHRALIAGARPADVRAWLATIAWQRAFDLSRR